MSLRTSLLCLVALAAVWWLLPAEAPLKQVATWQQLASPGELSQAHASLENDCAACHVPIDGPTRTSCVLCHANETSLLQRQPTAFHATVSSCNECHAEHRGRRPRPTAMDHDALAGLGLEELQGLGNSQGESLRAWMLAALDSAPAAHPGGDRAPSQRERLLDCRVCHAHEDRHFGLMGSDCVSCHTTFAWTLPAFRHPSPRSRDCAQCHQAPPSHYMGHFKMVSAKIAKKPKAVVSQCFECHRTTAWTDIPGVGHYKHH